MVNPVSNPIAVTSLAGMEKAEGQVSIAASRIARMPASVQAGQGGDVVDLSAEIVALMVARDNFMANVAAAKTGDELQRALLNIVA